MALERCPVCSEPFECGLHKAGRLIDGRPFITCPSFEEFVLGSNVMVVQMPEGFDDG